MKLKEWKKKYSNANQYYDGFHATELGNDTWKNAYELLNEDEEELGLDPLDTAHDEVIDKMEEWLLKDMSDKKYEKAEKWFEKMRNDLSEAIFAGLT